MLRIREDHFLGLRKDRFNSVMNEKRYLSIISNPDEKFKIKLEELGFDLTTIQQLEKDEKVKTINLAIPKYQRNVILGN